MNSIYNTPRRGEISPIPFRSSELGTKPGTAAAQGAGLNQSLHYSGIFDSTMDTAFSSKQKQKQHSQHMILNNSKESYSVLPSQSPKKSAIRTSSVSEEWQKFRQAENEAQLISNRIRLLQSEERKAINHVAVARKQAFDLLSIRSRNIQTSHDRNKRKEIYQNSLIAKYEEVQAIKEDKRLSKSIVLDAIRNKITIESHELKEAKKKYTEYIAKVKHDMFVQKIAQAYSVKQTEREQTQKKYFYQEMKKQQAKDNYDLRLSKSQEMSENKIKQVQKLEKTELHMIDSLRHTQVFKLNALKELEDIFKQAKATSTKEQIHVKPELLQYYTPSAAVPSTSKSPKFTTSTSGTPNAGSMSSSFLTDITTPQHSQYHSTSNSVERKSSQSSRNSISRLFLIKSSSKGPKKPVVNQSQMRSTTEEANEESDTIPISKGIAPAASSQNTPPNHSKSVPGTQRVQIDTFNRESIQIA